MMPNLLLTPISEQNAGNRVNYHVTLNSVPLCFDKIFGCSFAIICGFKQLICHIRQKTFHRSFAYITESGLGIFLQVFVVIK